MNTSLTKDQINIMNSILDKELDFLSADYNSAHIVPDKENYSTQKARGLTSKDFDKSTNSILYDRVNDSNFKEPRDITNQSNFKKHRTELQDPPNPSLRMQDDLLDLQSKIVDLEKKLGSLNNGPSPQRQREYNASNNRTSGYGGYEDVGRVQRTLRDELNDSLDDSPLKKKYENKSPFKSSTDKLANSYKDHSLSDSESPLRKQTHRGRRSASNTSNRKPTKSALEQSIKEAQSQLDQARGSLRKRSFSRNKSSSNLRSASKKKAEDSPPKEAGNYQEIIILNKKLMEVKKARDEERSALLNERAKNQEMMAHLEKLNAKMKKMQIDLEKFAKIDVDYNRLMESFEKSEYIRNQQKQLISSLQQEIEELKRNNEPVNLKSSENDEMKKKKSTKSKTTTTKKKVLM